jgi:2-dehydro-3-deoxygluconokinase
MGGNDMFDLVTFGEMLLRLAAPDTQRLEQASSLNVGVTGAEMNSCVVACRLGLKAAHVAKIPANPLGRMVINKIREQGIGVDYMIISSEDRLGLFFLEFGAMPRTHSVVYDRKYSSMSKIKPGEVDWREIFQHAKCLHTSGTLPALSKSSAAAWNESIKLARENNVLVSLDLNYRALLWDEDEARQTLSPSMEYCDILITTEEDIYKVFKISGKDYKEVAKKLQKKFNFKIVIITLREDTTIWNNNWTAIAYSEGEFYDDVKYFLEVIDRVGGGDAFSGGFLYAYIRYDGDIKKALQYGNASAALKHSIPGDLNWITLKEVEDLIKRGPGGGMGLRIKR